MRYLVAVLALAVLAIASPDGIFNGLDLLGYALLALALTLILRTRRAPARHPDRQ